jgi:hypothetical protein
MDVMTDGRWTDEWQLLRNGNPIQAWRYRVTGRGLVDAEDALASALAGY